MVPAEPPEVVEAVPTLDATDIHVWRDWLEVNGEHEQSIWVIVHHANAGAARVTYAELIEHPVCYGWADSKTRKRDEDGLLLKFTPRDPRST